MNDSYGTMKEKLMVQRLSQEAWVIFIETRGLATKVIFFLDNEEPY